MIGEMRSADTVDFRDAPARMLGVALHEYGSPHQFKVQLCALPREIKDHEVLVQVPPPPPPPSPIIMLQSKNAHFPNSLPGPCSTEATHSAQLIN